MDDKDVTFTLDEFDDAVAQECVNISGNPKYGDKLQGVAMFLMTGMSFCAHVRNILLDSKNKEE